MKAIRFPECDTVIAKDQDEYNTLYAYVERSTFEKQVVTCYKLSFLERLKVLFTGTLWFTQLTFGDNLQPQRPSVHKWDTLNKDYFDTLKRKLNGTNS